MLVDKLLSNIRWREGDAKGERSSIWVGKVRDAIVL